MKASEFKLIIQTPTVFFFEDEISQITIKIDQGYIGILKNHSPFVSNIRPCYFELTTKTGENKIGFISSGLIYVEKEKTIIITNNVVWKEGIDKEIYKEKLKIVEEEINNNKIKGFMLEKLKDEKEFYSIVLAN